MGMMEYWGIKEFATHHGLPAATVRRYKADGRLPEPDAAIGTGDTVHHGWRPDTAKGWQRPGQGARTDLKSWSATPFLHPSEHKGIAAALVEIHDLFMATARDDFEILVPEGDCPGLQRVDQYPVRHVVGINHIMVGRRVPQT